MMIVLELELENFKNAISEEMEIKTAIEFAPTVPQLRLLRDTADKAQFSNFIGSQWDQKICIPTLEKLKDGPEQAIYCLNLDPNHKIGAVVLLDSNTDIKKEAGGEKKTDSLIIEVDSTDPSYITIRACDFKFNLEMAQYRQVHPKTLSTLLEKSKLARSTVQAAIKKLHDEGKISEEFALAETLPEDQPQTEFLALDESKKIRAVTGRFISPNTEENRNYFINCNFSIIIIYINNSNYF